MKEKARDLGMNDTHYVEPTGLSSKNQSSARDLAILVKAAHEVQIIRELSTSPEYMVEVGNRSVQFRNTNGLVRSQQPPPNSGYQGWQPPIAPQMWQSYHIAGELMVVTVSATYGTLTLSGTSGLTFTVGNGTANATMNFSGSIASVTGSLA